MAERQGKEAVPGSGAVHPTTSGERDRRSPVRGDSGPWGMGRGGGPGCKSSGAHRTWGRRLCEEVAPSSETN